MHLASLGSGSRGNATLVRCGSLNILIDLGFGIRETERRLSCIGLRGDQIDACLVTHEHSDHLSGVARFAEKYATPVYLTAGTRRIWSQRTSLENINSNVIQMGQPFTVGHLQITPVPVPHDAKEPVQYIIDNGAVRLGVLTDLGTITSVVRRAYADCTALLIEANHDIDMLRRGNYPAALKRRVAGDWGHLNNQQTADLVAEIAARNQLTHLIVGHISQQNNHPDHVAAVIEPVAEEIGHIHYASQDQGLDWIDLNLEQPQ